MKSINRALIVAAIGAALSSAVFAQSPGAGGRTPDPSEDETTTTPSDRGPAQSRPGADRPGADRSTGESMDRNTNSGSPQDRDINRNEPAVNSEADPKKKRSFWDRVLGRNKSTEATEPGTSPADTDASGRRQDRVNDQ